MSSVAVDTTGLLLALVCSGALILGAVYGSDRRAPVTARELAFRLKHRRWLIPASLSVLLWPCIIAGGYFEVPDTREYWLRSRAAGDVECRPPSDSACVLDAAVTIVGRQLERDAVCAESVPTDECRARIRELVRGLDGVCLPSPGVPPTSLGLSTSVWQTIELSLLYRAISEGARSLRVVAPDPNGTHAWRSASAFAEAAYGASLQRCEGTSEALDAPRVLEVSSAWYTRHEHELRVGAFVVVEGPSGATMNLAASVSADGRPLVDRVFDETIPHGTTSIVMSISLTVEDTLPSGSRLRLSLEPGSVPPVELIPRSEPLVATWSGPAAREWGELVGAVADGADATMRRVAHDLEVRALRVLRVSPDLGSPVHVEGGCAGFVVAERSEARRLAAALDELLRCVSDERLQDGTVRVNDTQAPTSLSLVDTAARVPPMRMALVGFEPIVQVGLADGDVVPIAWARVDERSDLRAVVVRSPIFDRAVGELPPRTQAGIVELITWAANFVVHGERAVRLPAGGRGSRRWDIAPALRSADLQEAGGERAALRRGAAAALLFLVLALQLALFYQIYRLRGEES